MRNFRFPQANYDPLNHLSKFIEEEEFRMKDMNALGKVFYKVSKLTTTPEECNIESKLQLYQKAVDMMSTFWMDRLVIINDDAEQDRTKFGSKLHGLYKTVEKFSMDVSQQLDDVIKPLVLKCKSSLKVQFQIIYDNLDSM